MNEILLEIKSLFLKVASAAVWCAVHPQVSNAERWNKQVIPLLEKYYCRLEELGVDRQFSEAVFIFGIDGDVAYRSWTTVRT